MRWQASEPATSREAVAGPSVGSVGTRRSAWGCALGAAAFQGTGRHDAPDRYGRLYLAEDATSAVAEALAPFRGTGDLQPELLIRSGRQLALAELALANDAQLIDLDDPRVLDAEALRPSIVATGRRSVTQT